MVLFNTNANSEKTIYLSAKKTKYSGDIRIQNTQNWFKVFKKLKRKKN